MIVDMCRDRALGIGPASQLPITNHQLPITNYQSPAQTDMIIIQPELI
ncbi:hypothetical protein [Trichormus azollae]|jgi:hypothetical protein|uniref:Uncharacterized protein n=1 Tax=Nostoc azollae (strain 0708) TaxID=551115 RepID=D7DWP7_NOSA0|nr:hypothetical protein [Trichormus azollae]ADI65710.1 hypothetical protein Aazo_4387 ['Nostoc azollae' 0708]